MGQAPQYPIEAPAYWFSPPPRERWVPPPPLPWHVGHPHLATLIATLAIAAVVLLASVNWAGAEDAPKVVAPEFVPFMVDKANYDAVRKYLDGLKFGDALPVVQWLEGQEAKAKADWVAANAPKDGAK